MPVESNVIDQVGASAEVGLRISNCMIDQPLYRVGSLLMISHSLSEAYSRSSLRRGEPLQIACPIVLQVKEHFYELRHISTG
jgi:hypothetical protein